MTQRQANALQLRAALRCGCNRYVAAAIAELGSFGNRTMHNLLSGLVTGTFALLLLTLSALAETNRPSLPLRWGENGSLYRWNRYPYEIRTAYPFWDRLPVLDEFPKLLDFSNLRRSSDLDILASQLQTLSRCDFVDRKTGDYSEAFQKWRGWWDHYGAQLADRLKHEGQSYPEAWNDIPGALGIPCPDYPVALPTTWSFQLTLRSGDYGVMVEEVIDMRVTPTVASLGRNYRRRTAASWEAEKWAELSVAEAQSFLATLIYAIDNPWLYVDDNFNVPAKDRGLGQVNGRPSEWVSYYASVDWTGILDSADRVLINDDVWVWHTTNYQKHKTHLDSPNGVVFRVVRDRFPDPSWSATGSRWRAVGLGPKAEGPATGSRPNRSDTNGIPSAAGSPR